MASALDLFSPAAREWFRSAFAAPTEVQERGWHAVASGRHTLMTAPTGSGKTLAAFLWCLDRLAVETPPPPARERCRVLYVSPLKALAVDVERNLRAPLVGLRLPAGRRPRRRDRARRRAKAEGVGGRGPGRGQGHPGRGRPPARAPAIGHRRGRGGGAAPAPPLDLAGHLSAAAGAGAGAPLDD